VSAASAIARRAFADGRTRTGTFALLFLLVGLVQVVGYRRSYPTLAERAAFARSFGENKAVRLFYGVPHDLLTVGGYAGWRVAGTVSVFAALWGLLAAVRALRGEEDTGRQELVLAGSVSRRSALLSALAAIAAGGATLWLALLLGLVAGRLSFGGSAYLATATVSPLPVFVGVGTLASQLAPTRRLALGLSLGALTVALLLRVVADTATGLGALRWATPLGWVEALRPFAGPRPAVLLLPVIVSALLLAAGGAIALRRDVGTGLLSTADSTRPRRYLLSSPTAMALREERGSLAGWLAGIGFFALVFGLLSTSFSTATVSSNLQKQLHKVGGATITTPEGALGFYFVFFVLALSLFACSQVAAARREEAEQRLETLFALPLARRRWLAGRIALAGGATAALALATGVLAWAGAASQGADVSLARLLEAGANCLPTALLYLGLAVLAFAILPRASVGVAYGLVAATFLWDLFGALLGAPEWTLGISPFHHIGLVPAQAFHATAAIVMLAVAAVAALAALRIFERRDLSGA
jgi:ABC-2 type transport system permease protein